LPANDVPQGAITLRLLGAPTLIRSGQPVTLKRRQARALLFYVGAHDLTPRETLLGLLWQDKERAGAQQNLRTLLHGLRRELGSALRDDEGQLRLAPEVFVDVRAFEAGLTGDPHALHQALQLYRGEFLEGFGLAGAAAFEEWALLERERLRRLAVRGFTRLSRLQSADGRYVEALETLERALALDPLQEDVQREALQLHMLAGDRPGAIRRYDDLRRLLDDELGVTPMAETRAVYDAILSDRPEPTRPAMPTRRLSLPAQPVIESLPFVGRDQELNQLGAAFGHATLVLIEGEPGIGKTCLAMRSAEVRGLRPWLGAAGELETGVPYAMLIDALRAGLATLPGNGDRLTGLAPIWRQEAARLLPELVGPTQASAASGPTEEARIREALFRVILELHRVAPGLLMLDDLHWADAATLAVVGYLIRRASAEGEPLTVLATTRPYNAGSALGQLARGLAREGRLVSIHLGRLDRAEVDTFARSLSQTFAVPLAQWLARNSEGNPYILTELARDLRRSNTLRADGIVNLDALTAGPALPHTVSDLILSRLARLSDTGRRVLDAAVAVGRDFEGEVAWRAAGLSEDAGVDALDELRRSGLILVASRPTSPGAAEVFRFDHTLTMEAAYRDVGETRHRLMHRRVAEALEQLGRDHDDALSTVLAWHFREGGAPDRAAPYALRAGQRAVRLAAWHEAIEHFEHALAGTRAQALQPAILAALASAEANAGQAALAVDHLRRAVQLAKDPEENATLRLELGRAYFSQSRFGEAQALAAELVDSATELMVRARAEQLWGTALSVEGADLEAASMHLERAAALTTDLPSVDPAFLAQTQFERGGLAAQQGDLDAAIGLYRQSLEIAAGERDLSIWEVLSHNNLAYHLHLAGGAAALAEAEAHVQQGLRLAEERGLLSLLPYLHSTHGELRMAVGDLDGAAAAFGTGLAQAEAIGLGERIAGLTANLGLVARDRGDTATAIHRLSTGLAQADAIGTQHLAAQIRVWLAPLLPWPEAEAHLERARLVAEAGGRRRLLEQIEAALSQRPLRAA